MDSDPVFVRPGPARIDPGEAVGGIVVHIYAVPSCDLLHVGRLPGSVPPDRVVDLIVDDVDIAMRKCEAYDEVCIVMFDGDTGDRLSHWPTSWN